MSRTSATLRAVPNPNESVDLLLCWALLALSDASEEGVSALLLLEAWLLDSRARRNAALLAAAAEGLGKAALPPAELDGVAGVVGEAHEPGVLGQPGEEARVLDQLGDKACDKGKLGALEDCVTRGER